jgi:hypothetical protein
MEEMMSNTITVTLKLTAKEVVQLKRLMTASLLELDVSSEAEKQLWKKLDARRVKVFLQREQLR